MNIKDLLKDAYKEGMTIEEINKALETIELPTPESPAPNKDGELERLKAALSKSNSEAAEYKKQLRAKMTDDEQKEAERAAKEAERDELLASLQKDKAISDSKVQFLALGYEAALAEETAKAMVDGDMAKVFTNQKRHLEAVEKKVRADALKETPKPAPGGGNESITQEQFDAMGYTDRLNVFNESPDLYTKLTGGNE